LEGALPTLEVVLTTILFLGVGIKGVLVLLRRFAGQAESFTGKVFRFILAVVVVFLILHFACDLSLERVP